MHTTEDDTPIRTKGVVAFLANKRNAVKKPKVSAEDRLYGNLLETFVRNVHIRSRVFVNYNERSIAVKVANPNSMDQLAIDRTHIIALEKFVAKEHINVRRFDGSLIYHLQYTNTPH